MGLIADNDTDNLTTTTCCSPIGWWGWASSLIGWGGDTGPSGHTAGCLTLGGEWRGWTLEYCQGGFGEWLAWDQYIASSHLGLAPVIILMLVTPPHHHNGQHVQNQGFMTKPWLNFNQIEIYYQGQSAPSQNWCEIQFGTDIVHWLFNWRGRVETN